MAVLYENMQNVVTEWLAFLLSVRDFPTSNLDPQTGYPY
jgi:hypothetical protein